MGGVWHQIKYDPAIRSLIALPRRLITVPTDTITPMVQQAWCLLSLHSSVSISWSTSWSRSIKATVKSSKNFSAAPSRSAYWTTNSEVLEMVSVHPVPVPALPTKMTPRLEDWSPHNFWECAPLLPNSGYALIGGRPPFTWGVNW